MKNIAQSDPKIKPQQPKFPLETLQGIAAAALIGAPEKRCMNAQRLIARRKAWRVSVEAIGVDWEVARHIARFAGMNPNPMRQQFVSASKGAPVPVIVEHRKPKRRRASRVRQMVEAR